MKILSNGYFSLPIATEELSRGLRPSKRLGRNNSYLISCIGAVGRDKVLQVMDELTRVDTSVITDSFPYPQIFILTNMILVCGSQDIYELVSGSLDLKLHLDNPGSTWSVVDFFDYVYMSNAKVAVVRDAESKVFALSDDLPIAMSICDFNGQVLIGAPNSTIS